MRYENVTLHNPEAFEAMRKAGQLAADVLDYLTPFVKPKISTGTLNDLAHEYIISHGAIPAPLNYKGFPKSTCISVNHVVCHGIPGEKILNEGDILNIDVTVILDGWFGDTSRMFFAGKPSIKAKILCDITYQCLMEGIKVCKPGNKLGDIGYKIQSLAEGQRFSVVRDFTGHGLGKVFHCAPTILHFGDPDQGMELKPGMFFTVEPMINVGGYATKILSDGWTAVTRDRSLSAQFEHTIGITEKGPEIFTQSKLGFNKPPYEI